MKTQTKIKKQTTYSALKNDTLDLFNLLIVYKGNDEMTEWVKQRIDFNVERMLEILKNGDN